tara:strand:+ start:2967 stop:3299 length:333 start_codon:yes stop_codon:yes gene_type:complete
MIKLIVFTTFLFFHFASKAGNIALKKINISIINNLAIIEQYKEPVLKAYRDIGYQIRFIEMPLAREILEINKGTIDAIVLGLSILEQNNSNLIRVPIILASGDLLLYCQK